VRFTAARAHRGRTDPAHLPFRLDGRDKMEPELTYHQAMALLEWQYELGVDEVIGEVPVNRYDLPATSPAFRKGPPGSGNTSRETGPGTPDTAPSAVRAVDPAREAHGIAADIDSLDSLKEAVATFPYCELRQGARNTVFADGNPEARVMVIGEAPGRDEDFHGKPFVGRAGQLLDLMFDAIGMRRAETDRDRALYITNILPWRPPRNRDPKPEEMGMMLPFVHRHIELAEPEILVLMGNISCQALLGRRGITKLRGNWTDVLGRPALPMFHPAYLLRNPRAKREAWSDLLTLQSRLKSS